MDLSSMMQVVPIIVSIAVTVIQCFFGYKLFRYIMGFWGFALFGFVGYTIGGLFDNQMVEMVASAVLGTVGAFIAYKFYKAGVFLQGLIAGFLIGGAVPLFMGWPPVTSVAVGVVSGILLGLLTLYVFKPLIILTSAISGGMGAGAGVVALFSVSQNIGAFIGIALSVLGIGYQFYTIGKSRGAKQAKDKKDKEDKKEEKIVEEVDAEHTVDAVTAADIAEYADDDSDNPVEEETKEGETDVAATEELPEVFAEEAGSFEKLSDEE